MPLSWNEIKSRALAFSNEWQDEASEDAEAKSFWDGFFHVFGISRRRVASFELPVKKLGDKQGFIDLFWKGVLLVEHKSRGRDLDKAHSQALDYFPGLKEHELPRYVLVSDFARFRLYDLEENEEFEFTLAELHQHIHRFAFIAGYQTHKIQEQDPVNIEAAERMGKLHDRLLEIGYSGHNLEVHLVRLLFCLFAEDTGIFERQQFQNYLEERTSEDGSDLASRLHTLFEVLNTPTEQRFKNLDEQLAAFPYINGQLFEETLRTASFDSAMRQSLLDCCALDWSRISPAIFGSLFQSIMDKTARRNLGAHYTSEANILKLIKPLFLDELWAEFERAKTNARKLAEFHTKLRSLTFFDPACGCGNFLVIAYRELRLLELEVLRASSKNDGQMALDVSSLIQINVDQFFGIEIEEFPAQIAQVALWLMDHQMNLAVSEEFGNYFARIPLKARGTIVHGNALQLEWSEVIAPEKLSYIIGNPPFIGKNYRSKEQDADLEQVFTNTANMEPVRLYKSLDFVTAWHYKATAMMQHNHKIKTALVSTNSITQGEQVAILWPALLNAGVQIHFAHRTFSWSNEAKGKAAVHCVIIGFALHDTDKKTLFAYEDIKGEPQEIAVKNINPYLIDAPALIVDSRTKPICDIAEMVNGSKPTDGGHLILSEDEKIQLITEEPNAEKYIRQFVGAEEFINNKMRYCLWLVDCPPQELRAMPKVLARVEAVKQMRLASTDKTTRSDAATPTLFQKIRQPDADYLLIPSVSSENRYYVPYGYLSKDVIVSNLVNTVPDATLYHFGVLTSTMHNAWMRTVAGRLESRYRYSAKIVYNNFPWPENPSEAHTQKIETAAQAVLDARAQFPDSSLADLYDPLTMPPVLLKAHQALDKAVDAAYLEQHKGKKSFATEAERVAFLFERYQELLAAERALLSRK